MIKRILIILVAAIVVITTMIIDPPDGLSVVGLRVLGIVLATIILWATEVIPIGVTAILIVAAVPLLGILPYGDTWRASINQAFFFLIASFGICAGLKNTTLAQRMMTFIFKHTGNNSYKIIMGYTILASLVSVIVSDSAACITTLGFATMFLNRIGRPKPGTSKLAKCLMMCIPMGCMAGGMATPASNSINIIALGVIESAFGIEISFLQWIVIGIPLAVVMTFFTGYTLPRFFKPEKIEDSYWQAFQKSQGGMGRLNAAEIKFIIIVVLMIAGWVSTTWISSINMAVVAILGTTLMFLPGIDLINGRDFMREIRPEVLVMTPGASLLASVVVSTGAGAFFINTIFNHAETWSIWIVLPAISLICCLAHIAIPIGSAVIGITSSTLLPLCFTCGVDPIVATIILSIWGGATYMLPSEGLYVLTYSYGHYNHKDLSSYGLIPTSAWFILSVTLVPLLVNIFF